MIISAYDIMHILRHEPTLEYKDYKTKNQATAWLLRFKVANISFKRNNTFHCIIAIVCLASIFITLSLYMIILLNLLD